ncbi:MAG TPA: hypothetical protein PKG82_09875 [Myxococcota bacterium]|nr:hypothetical protein [Myxococcota bacterium]
MRGEGLPHGARALKTVAIVGLPVVAILLGLGGCDRVPEDRRGHSDENNAASPHSGSAVQWRPEGLEAVRFLAAVHGFAERAPDASLLAAIEPFLKTSVCRRMAGAMQPADIRALLSRKPSSVVIKGLRFVVSFADPAGGASAEMGSGGDAAPAPAPAILRQPLVLFYSDGTFRIDLDASSRLRPVPPPEPSPQNLTIGLDEALADIPGTGSPAATISFDNGIAVKCTLFSDSAPENVAAFVSLARGLRSTRMTVGPDHGEGPAGDVSDAAGQTPTGQDNGGGSFSSWAKRPWYDGMALGRALGGAAISFGRTSDPGFLVPDEFAAGVRHDRPGLLTTLPERPEWGNGAVAITRGAIREHDDRGTIIGACDTESTTRLFSDFAAAEREKRQVLVQGITFSRNP